MGINDLRFGRFELQPEARQLLFDGAPAKLGARAFDLLLALIERRDRTVSKIELLDIVWPGLVVEENNLQVHISVLRKLLGPAVIATIPGRGYRFTAMLDAADAIPAAGSTLPAIPHNLPQQRTHFIGREVVLVECARLLQDVRLLTLTGIGGCGKTRLALKLAQQQLASFADGVWFVDLAPLQEPQRVALAVASTLGVREEPGTSLIERLAAHLTTRRTLIVLDNCEHVIDAVVELVDALRAACAELKIVVTSREGMGVAGEQIFPVGPLSLPAGADRDAIQGSEAVRLFIDRARLALPDFALDERNASAIAEICRRLDGIALAIELAAARVKMLAVEEIRARLDDRFRFLTGGSRALPRHQTLQATLQWSYDHLTSQEQQLFSQLAVFAGSCTLAAATHVADAADEYAVLELLTHLHDKSLLMVNRDGAAEPRYRMLETVRQYALERLNEVGKGDAIRALHLRYYVALAEEAGQQIHGPQQAAWMARLQLEQENLIAAHTWCEHAPGGGEAGLRLVASLWRYWIQSSLFTIRGYHFALAALARAGEEADALWRCRALWVTGQMAHFLGHYDEAMNYAEQSLALARAIDNAEQIAAGLSLRAIGFNVSGQPLRALADLEEALDFARTLGPHFRLSTAFNVLGEVHRSLGNFAAAENCYEESIRVARDLHDSRGIAVPSCNLARLLIAASRLERVRALLLEILAISAAAKLTAMGRHVLEITAGLAATLDDHVSAARFSGAAHARMRVTGSKRDPVDEAFVAAAVARAQTALGTVAFAAADAAGQALAYDAAVAEAREWLERVA